MTVHQHRRDDAWPVHRCPFLLDVPVHRAEREHLGEPAAVPAYR